MAITYPLTAPTTPGNRSIRWTPRTVVGFTSSPFTGQQQVFAWPGQWWEVTIELPAMKDPAAGPWEAFFLALNAQEGSFLLGDSVRRTPLGTVTGTLTVGSGAAAGSTALPISGATGTFVAGDWLQVSTGTTARLHRVIQVNSSSSVDVFPRLRTAYAAGTLIVKTSPVGLFRLQGPVPWGYDARKLCEGLTFNAVEVVP